MATQGYDRQSDFLTVREAAIYFKATPATVTRWLREGVVPGYKFGKGWRMSLRMLRRMVDDGR